MVPRYKIATALSENNDPMAVVKFQFELELTIGPELVDDLKGMLREGLPDPSRSPYPESAKADYAFAMEMASAIEDVTTMMTTLKANAEAIGPKAVADYRRLVRTYEQDWIPAGTDISFDGIVAIHRSCAAFQGVRLEIDEQNLSADIVYSAGLTQYRDTVTRDNLDQMKAKYEAIARRLEAASGAENGATSQIAVMAGPVAAWFFREVIKRVAIAIIDLAEKAEERRRQAARDRAEQEALDKAYRAEKERIRDAAEKGGYYREQVGKDLFKT
ncbi:MAG: hypothetical protein ACK5XE_10545 [Burkholderiales bacterium]